MTSFVARSRRTALTLVAATAAVLAAAPIASQAAPTRPTARTHHAKPAARSGSVRSFDGAILRDVNGSRHHHKAHAYTMNHRLWAIAHSYAEHLAKTGVLVHNPGLEHAITKQCPAWTDLGENIGYETGTSAHALYEGYMHSAPHRANILDKSYRQVGIASVQVVRNGQVQQWNVMDFANHCHG